MMTTASPESHLRIVVDDAEAGGERVGERQQTSKSVSGGTTVTRFSERIRVVGKS
jgi:hypothetical protein